MPRARAGSAGVQKGRAPKGHKLPEWFPSGEVLLQTQPYKKKWQLGDIVGQGGFGLIYNAFDVTDGPASAEPCCVKMEPLDNGPLFCEVHFYQRVAKPDSILEWAKVKKQRYLGVPQFLGYGQHKKGDKQYRFLVMQRLSTDLQKIFEQNGRAFSEETTFGIGLRMLDVLEYIHDKGYCHADIKAANILLGYNGGKTDCNQVYLVDYGLACRFLVDGAHKPEKEDPKRAHDGTAEYASLDAHNGVSPSRRGDLEILGYCMLEWLAGSLPWKNYGANKDMVRDLKIKYMNDLPGLFKACFGSRPCPEGLKKYFGVISKLTYDEKPDYNQLRQFLRSGTNNEWVLGLTDKGSPAKGIKCKNDAPGSSSPKVAQILPSSFKASPRVGRSRPAISNGSGRSTSASTSSSRARTSLAYAKAKQTPAVSSTKIPGARASPRRGPATASPAGSKRRLSTTRGPRKQLPKSKSSVSSPAGSRVPSARKDSSVTELEGEDAIEGSPHQEETQRKYCRII